MAEQNEKTMQESGEKKYVKVMQNPRETIFDYINRLREMQKTVTDETVYYGRFEDEHCNLSYFSADCLPRLTPDTEYEYSEATSGNILEIMENEKTDIIRRINNGEEVHSYMIFDNIGFISSNELLDAKDIRALFDYKWKLRNILAKEYTREEREQEEAEEKARDEEKAGIKEKYVKVPKKYKEEIIDYIKRLSELQQSALENTVYYGFYENENGETYLDGRNIHQIDFEKNYIYVPDRPGSIPEQMAYLRSLAENGQDVYSLYGNIGLVTSDELLQCKSAEDVNKLFKEHFEAQKNLRHIDMLFENDR